MNYVPVIVRVLPGKPVQGIGAAACVPMTESLCTLIVLLWFSFISPRMFIGA